MDISLPNSRLSSEEAMAKTRKRTTNLPQRRCWNCRSRKVACDRADPGCKNCERRGMQCLGYGLKLSWPRPNDTRRFSEGHQHRILTIRSRKLEFINATSHDVEVKNGARRFPSRRGHLTTKSVTQNDRLDSMARQLLRASIPRDPYTRGMANFDPYLDTNRYRAVSALVSSTCENMGEDLYGLLVRMSLGDDHPPAQATRHAVAAISYHHVGQEEVALTHKANSISALHRSVERLGSGDLDTKEAFQAMAASMLLSVYESLYSNSSTVSCSVFLCGSKQLASSIHTPHASYEGDSAMILDWIFYHDTMYKFSSRHWHAKRWENPLMEANVVVSKAAFSPMRQMILASAGCSLELLDLLSQTISAVYDRTDPRHLSPSHLSTLRTLDYRIKNLVQVTRVESISSNSSDSPERTSHSHNAALFYRLAVHIYLLRVAQGLPLSSPKVHSLIDSAFETLSLLPYCERPWPLFVVALEARTEDERRLVLDKIEAGVKAKPFGNMCAAREMVTRAWVQKDLAMDGSGFGEGEGDMSGVYNAAVRGLGGMPSFS
ncbi:fungal-specific transcription factor domain-containing protein [Podospora aff. communis PSN243]|uniref:Fungal-specific transcription factor domain-containing protein n=1 Tax=Podospora aff. communis PSN243 TaxID=3040156 RepID=A0AAV9GGI2_9PEZI|nr:fungal-specific transcription factor domain-containing protein [Podospora aff. communis PSN243]